MSTQSDDRQAFWFSSVLNALGLVIPSRQSTMQGGSTKLRPISDILSRTGREPRSPE